MMFLRSVSCVSAVARGVGVFVFQPFLEAAEEQPVFAVLLVFAAVEVALNLKASMHHEGITHHGEPQPCYMKLARLRGNRGEVGMRESQRM